MPHLKHWVVWLSISSSAAHDTRRELAPVVFLAPSPNVLLVQKRFGVGSLNDLIALANSRSGRPLTFASVGKGSFHHFSMELFRIAAGIELVHVPYKGVTSAMLAFIRGDVDLYCSDLPGALAGIRSGDLKALAVTSATRVATLPDVPTMAEQGIADFNVATWWGVMGPRALAPEIVATLNQAVNAVLATQDMAARFDGLGAERLGGTAAQFADFFKAEVATWSGLIRAEGIKAE